MQSLQPSHASPLATGPTLARLELRDNSQPAGLRQVEIQRRKILFERLCVGVLVKVAVPTSAYRGVLMSLVVTGTGNFLYRTQLLHQDPDLSVPLYDHPERATMEAHWRRWAQALGVPLLVERDPGCIESVSQKPAPTQAQPLRRTRALTRERRGAFARRRKTGRIALLGVHYSAAHEIIARN